MRVVAALLCLSGCLWSCSQRGAKRSPVPSDPAPAPTAAPTSGPDVDPRVKPLFDEFVGECQTRGHTRCLERLASFKRVRVGVDVVEVFSGEVWFPGGTNDAERVVDETPFLGASEIVVRLRPFIGGNSACYGKILLYHMLGHALLGWKHPEAQADGVRFSNTSIMGYELYPICENIADNMPVLVSDLFDGTLRDDVADGSYARGEAETPQAYDARMAGLISRLPVRGSLLSSQP